VKLTADDSAEHLEEWFNLQVGAFLVYVRGTELRSLYPTSLSYGVDISSCIAYLKGALFGRSLCDWLESAACSIVGFQIRACFR
jgi:hypothetical protein